MLEDAQAQLVGSELVELGFAQIEPQELIAAPARLGCKLLGAHIHALLFLSALFAAWGFALNSFQGRHKGICAEKGYRVSGEIKLIEPCHLGQGLDEVAEGGWARTDVAQVQCFEGAELIFAGALGQRNERLSEVRKLAVFNARVMAEVQRLHHGSHRRIREEDLNSLDD